MATPPQRLPIVNSDDGTWGDILRQYLKKEHYDDGTDNSVNGGHQNVTIRAGSATAAPLTFASGPRLTSPAAGSVEFLNDSLYFTITTGNTRKQVAMYDDGSGTDGQILKRSSGVPVWGSTNTGFSVPAAITGTSYTISSSDTVILANATSNNVTITLPSAASFSGYRFYIKRIDGSANTVTVSCTDNIDGAASQTLPIQYMSIAVVSNGATWYIL